MACFKDGLEAAAAVIEEQDSGLFGAQWIKELAAAVRAIPVPADDGSGVMPTIDASFDDFKEVYRTLNAGGNGQRNHWGPAKRKFEQLVRVRKHDPQAIVTGTQNYAASRPDPQYVRAPEVFLNKEMFMTDYSEAIRAADRGSVPGSTAFDVVESLRAR